MGESERVAAFLDQWEKAGVYNDAVYTLGRIEGDYVLAVADLRTLAAKAALVDEMRDLTHRYALPGVFADILYDL
jgi:hypothetical protein